MMAPREAVGSIYRLVLAGRPVLLGWLLAGMASISLFAVGSTMNPATSDAHPLGLAEAKERIAILRSELARCDELYFKKAVDCR